MYFPLNIPGRRSCVHALMKGKGEHSACSVAMTCVVEQGQLVSTLGASGSITGAHDPERSVWKNGYGKQVWLLRSLALQPDAAPPLPPKHRSWLQPAAALHQRPGRSAEVQPHLTPASSQLGRATGLVRLGPEKLPVFRSDLCCV